MEVSSHALDQHRTAGIDFAVGVFTNLTGDHLDYHGSMDAYLEAKTQLFSALAPDAACILNRDDPAGEALAAATEAAVTWYGLSPAADVYGRIREIDASGSLFELVTSEGSVRIGTPLIGRHNVYNCLAAAAAARALDVDSSRHRPRPGRHPPDRRTTRTRPLRRRVRSLRRLRPHRRRPGQRPRLAPPDHPRDS